MYGVRNSIWFVAGDPVFDETAVQDALRRLAPEVKVRMVPATVSSTLWWRSQPDLLLYGESALGPLHPLIARARAWPTRTVLVTSDWSRPTYDFDADYVVPLPQSAGRLAFSLRRAIGEPQAPTIELAGA
jgi:hypothetical protein